MFIEWILTTRRARFSSIMQYKKVDCTTQIKFEYFNFNSAWMLTASRVEWAVRSQHTPPGQSPVSSNVEWSPQYTVRSTMGHFYCTTFLQCWGGHEADSGQTAVSGLRMSVLTAGPARSCMSWFLLRYLQILNIAAQTDGPGQSLQLTNVQLVVSLAFLLYISALLHPCKYLIMKLKLLTINLTNLFQTEDIFSIQFPSGMRRWMTEVTSEIEKETNSWYVF